MDAGGAGGAVGVSVWLDCPLAVIEQRIAGQAHRPLARDPEKFRALYEARKPDYARADYRVEVSKDASSDAADVVRQIQTLGLL